MEEGGALPSGEETARMLDFSRGNPAGGRLPALLPVPAEVHVRLSGKRGLVSPRQESVYNIIMMEELQTVVSIGGGGVTKLVDGKTGGSSACPTPSTPTTT